jgi:hypothetical protein
MLALERRGDLVPMLLHAARSRREGRHCSCTGATGRARVTYLSRCLHMCMQEKVSGTVVEDATQLARAAKELILSHDREVEAQKSIMQLQRDLTASDRCGVDNLDVKTT